MGTVHLARLMGPIGFARTVAVKQMHRHLASEERARTMFIDEARMAARVRHPNAVPVLDVVAVDRDLLLVMDYVHGESLARLVAAKDGVREPVPVAIASAILIGVLHGLHAAHEATDEKGQPLGLVHRDVSPQNILVGLDGVPRVVDFGIAKAAGRLQTTTDGQLKGKAAYLAPEQILDGVVDRRADIYAASVVLWEVLAGRRLFEGGGTASTLRQVLEPKYEPPSRYAPSVPAEVDALVLKGLAWEPGARFAAAWDMATALETVAPPASVRQVSEWVDAVAGETLRARARRVADIESASTGGASDEVVEVRRPGQSQDHISTQIEAVSARSLSAASGATDATDATDVTDLTDATDATLGILTQRTPSTVLTRSSPRSGSSRRLAVAGIGLAVIAVGSAIAIGAYRANAQSEPLRDGVVVATPPPPDRAGAPEPVSTPHAAVAAGAPVSSAPADPQPPASSSPSPPAASASATAAAKRKTPRRVPAGPGSNCAVPFTWAPDGTKVPKVECL